MEKKTFWKKMITDPFENLKGRIGRDLKMNTRDVNGLKKYKKRK